MLSPYEVLGVPEGSSLDVCKRAYRRLANRYHPDNPTGDIDKFQEVSKAWEQIQNPQPEVPDFTIKRSYLRHQSLFSFA